MIKIPLYTWWKARKYFIFPKVHFYIGTTKDGKGYENPYSSTKGLSYSDVNWKRKFNMIRYEADPFISLIIGHYQIAIWFSIPKIKRHYINIEEYLMGEDYWEPMLWYVYGKNHSLKEAYKKCPGWTRVVGTKIVSLGPGIDPNILTTKGKLELLNCILNDKFRSKQRKCNSLDR